MPVVCKPLHMLHCKVVCRYRMPDFAQVAAIQIAHPQTLHLLNGRMDAGDYAVQQRQQGRRLFIAQFINDAFGNPGKSSKSRIVA